MQQVCIVIPCYNESRRLLIEDYIDAYNKYINFDFLFVNDGSTDITLDVISTLMETRELRMSVINLENNVGKGEAVRVAMLEANGRNKYGIIGFLDADLSISFYEVDRQLKYFSNSSTEFVFASRVQTLGSNIKKKFYRHLLGRVFATFASTALNIKVYDTQCGSKFFRSDLVERIFSKKFISRWIFDIEIFFRLKMIKSKMQKTCKEVPLESCVHVEGSKLKLSYYLIFPYDLIRIILHYRFKI